jgi:restriction system protein
LADLPEERMANILRQANEALSAELLEKIKAESSAFFERLVVQLLVAMGYGGNRANAGQVTQLSADNGIDGIINEDPLGLDTIYLQAKRWQDPVGEGPVRDFIGALVIKGVKKGVFLTTSYFTPAARAAVLGNKSDQKIVLIDGVRLAALMIEHNLGVSVAQNFALKRLDSDFFGEA